METQATEEAIATDAVAVRKVLDFDPETGVFTWKVSRGGKSRKGAVAGYQNRLGYWHVTCLGMEHKAHRLAWLYVNGRWPRDQLDHINGIRNDNRITNLRECSREENYQNKAPYRNNTSGFTGVMWHEPNQAWLARIGVGGRKLCLGYHASPEAAYSAYLEAKATHHHFQPNPRQV